MHASIAVYLMIVGGPIAPQMDTIDVPLTIDYLSPAALDDLERKQRNRRYKLPVPPTLGDDQSVGNENRGNRGRYVPPTDPNAQQRRQQATMPMSPTDPGNTAGGIGGAGGGGYAPGRTPALPGGGIGQSNEGYYNNNRTSQFNPGASSFNKPVNGQYGGYGVQTQAAPVPHTPVAGDSLRGIMDVANRTNGSGYGVPSNPMLNMQPTDQRPFNDYQRPSGYSPYMSLYNTPTNNGTVSTYTSTVQPMIQQQQYNRQVAEQIQGFRNAIVAPATGSGGMDMNVGTGLLNPGSVLNYGPPQMNR